MGGRREEGGVDGTMLVQRVKGNMDLTPDLSFVTVVENQDVFGFRT